MPDRNLTAGQVAQRLSRLRGLAQLESALEARARSLPASPPKSPPRIFAEKVHMRLCELRALMELTEHLHRLRPPGG